VYFNYNFKWLCLFLWKSQFFLTMKLCMITICYDLSDMCSLEVFILSILYGTQGKSSDKAVFVFK